MPKSLYICYFGVREPLVQTQVVPYLREILKDGIGISLLTFEPQRGTEDKQEFQKFRQQLAAEGIDWEWLPYHKRPSAIATAWDIARGAFFIRRRIRRFDVLHGRVHVPTFMAAIARKFSRHKPKILFDIRGFFPEEYTDAGIWPEGGWLYRGAKRIERWLMKNADGFVVLTNRAKEILFTVDERRPVEVIPCCVDMERFASANNGSCAAVRRELGIGDRFVGVYVGAFGGWYMAEETAEFFGVMKRREPNAFALVLTQSRPEMIEPLLQAQDFDAGDYFIAKVPSADIPKYLSAADIAVSFIKPCYSKQASSPTKNAEYLACGLPIVANTGIGDVDELIEGRKVGALIRSFDTDSCVHALERVEALGDISDHCRTVAASEFDLVTVGGVRYRSLYSRLLK